MRRIDNGGFILIISIFIIMSIIIILFIGVNIINKNHQFIDEQNTYDAFYNRAKDNVEVIAKFDKNNNSDGLGNDILSCSGGLISNSKNNGAICGGAWIAGSDGIDDMCDNDNKTPYFADKGLFLGDLFVNNSLMNDDDADARVFNIGFIYPGEQKTIFYFDKNIANKIVSNNYNTYYSLPEIGKFATMSITLKGGATSTGSLTINTRNGIGDDYFITNKKSDISLESSGILTSSANFDGTQPYLFEPNSDKTYIINIFNPTTSIISYEIILKDNKNIPIYQVPITNNDYGISIPYYEGNVGKFDLEMRKINIYTKNR